MISSTLLTIAALCIPLNALAFRLPVSAMNYRRAGASVGEIFAGAPGKIKALLPLLSQVET